MQTEHLKTVQAKKKGVPKTEEEKQKISETLKGRKLSKEHKINIGKSQLGIPLTEIHKEKISKGKKGKSIKGHPHTEETKLKMSKSKAGKLNPNFGKPPHKNSGKGKGSYYTKLDGNKIYLRSSWELKFAIWLDEKRKNWEYETKAYPVNFYSNEGETIRESTYRPDFLVEGEGWYEIKGFWRDEDSELKFEAFKKQYPEEKITLLMKPELIALGIDIK